MSSPFQDDPSRGTNKRTQQQLAAEMIFLTHNEGIHEVNLGWHPQGDELLWRPDLQDPLRLLTRAQVRSSAARPGSVERW